MVGAVSVGIFLRVRLVLWIVHLFGSGLTVSVIEMPITLHLGRLVVL